MNDKPIIFGVTGWKNSGKTTMVAALVSEFSARGLKVSTIKHAHHSFDIDHEGTDSWQHRKAGAGEVAGAVSRRPSLTRTRVCRSESEVSAVVGGTIRGMMWTASPCPPFSAIAVRELFMQSGLSVG